MGIYKYALIILFFSTQLGARPISYSGGSTLTLTSDKLNDNIYYHYSPNYRYSLGLEAVEDKVLNKKYGYFRFTYLLDRKNIAISQRNLYFQYGVSSRGLDNQFYGIHGDWETRRWFSGFGYKKTETKLIDFSEQFLQLGIAPYIGDYGDFHTWIMMKSKRNSITNDWSTFPVLKFFKGNALFEFGYSHTTDWDVYTTYRF